jgi:hypothetical protein
LAVESAAAGTAHQMPEQMMVVSAVELAGRVLVEPVRELGEQVLIESRASHIAEVVEPESLMVEPIEPNNWAGFA